MLSVQEFVNCFTTELSLTTIHEAFNYLFAIRWNYGTVVGVQDKSLEYNMKSEWLQREETMKWKSTYFLPKG